MVNKVRSQKSKLKSFIIFVAVFCLFNNILAKESNNLHEVFKTANKLYEKSNFVDAAGKYQSLVDEGIKDKVLYYNLGNAYYKSNKLGLAILNFKRAYKLSPRDKDIIANLKFVREKVVDQIKDEKPLPQIIWEKAISFLTLNEWIIICGIFYLLFMSIWIYSVFKKEVSSGMETIRTIALIIFLFTLIFSISSYWANKQLEGVITIEQVEVRNGPGTNYTTGFILHEGTEVSCLRESEGWIEILLPNGLKGWVEKNVLQLLSKQPQLYYQ